MKLYIGTMSGTSADGIDAALLYTDGQAHIKMLKGIYVPYAPDVRQRILQATKEMEVGVVALLERDLTILHAQAVHNLLTQEGLKANEIEAIGFHGQTIRHIPQQQVTIQIGNAAMLGQLTGIGVVSDFRRRDLAAGGQGAPLVPIFHQALAQHLGLGSIAFLNIGGISNITYVAKDGELYAGDVGPGNAPLDDITLAELGQPYDIVGQVAAQGRVHKGLLQQLLSDPFFQLPIPKSLDRRHFDYTSLAGLSTQDKLATLVEFIAEAICYAIKQLAECPTQVVVSGGGCHNNYLMQRITSLLLPMPVQDISAMGVDADFAEAYAFAYLAARSLQNLPISFQNTTGSPQALSGGAFYRVSF